MWDLYHGGLSEKIQQEFTRAAMLIGDSPLHILDTPQISIGQLRATARRLRKIHKVELIVVDYLQLMTAGMMGRNDNREREVAMISGGIKAMAKELDIPIVVLSQLNRQSDKEEGGKPKLSNLRESGAIEQDADIVCLLHRKDAKDEEGRPLDAIPAEMIIAKNRNGPVGEIRLTFLTKYTRFEDFTGVDD